MKRTKKRQAAIDAGMTEVIRRCREPHVDEDMLCARCHGRGMYILPHANPPRGAALCLRRCEADGIPAHCARCNGLNVPAHAKGCTGVVVPPGACEFCDDLHPRAAAGGAP